MEVIFTVVIVVFTLFAFLITWIGIPGTFCMSIVALVWGWSINFSVITVNHLIFMFGISVLFEVLEFFLGGIAARYYGASKRSAVFAILGGIVGAIIGAGFFILIGALVGLLIGSYLGAYLSEKLSGKTSSESVRAALGAVLGNIVSKTVKSTTAVIMGVWMIKVLVINNG